jgi:hypothetical protein
MRSLILVDLCLNTTRFAPEFMRFVHYKIVIHHSHHHLPDFFVVAADHLNLLTQVC